MKKDQTSGLGFNGQDNSDKPTGYLKKYQSNASGKTGRENYGRGPTKAGVTGKSVPNPTASKGKINGGATVTCPGMSINVGRGPTKGNQK